MSGGPQPCILGVGCAVPKKTRKNDDPIFDYLNDLKDHEKSPFQGFSERRVLSPAQELIHMMVPAAKDAIELARAANKEPAPIDMLLGCASVSPNRGPSELTLLHRELNRLAKDRRNPQPHLEIPNHALPEIVGNDFSNFNVALVFADALIKAGYKKRILITIGGNWSRAVDYHTPQAASAADGAGAAVVGIPDADADERHKWHVLGEKAVVNSENLGLMYLAGDPVPNESGRRPREEPQSSLKTSPYFHITAGGKKAFGGFGFETPAIMANELLNEHNLSGNDVTLIAHQASTVLMRKWDEIIKPANFFSTIEFYANMTLATYPVNLALALAEAGASGYAERKKMIAEFASPKLVSPKAEKDEYQSVKQMREMSNVDVFERDFWAPDVPFTENLLSEERDAGNWEIKKVETNYILLLALGYDMHAHALLLGNFERIGKSKAAA